MKLVDSSGWLEYLSDGRLAETYAAHLLDPSIVITPTVVLYEVYKVAKRERSEDVALVAIADMKQTHVVRLTSSLALAAADASLEHGLAMADAIVYATAAAHGADLITSDADFAGLPDVTYLPLA